MKKIIVVSKFKKKVENFYLFHFIGYFKGHRISMIKINNGKFEKNKTYVLYLNDYEIKDSFLVGKASEYRKID